MTPAEMLAHYDLEGRRDNNPLGGLREVLPDVVRHHLPQEERGFIAYSCLRDSTADAAIEAQIAHYRAHGWGFEWKYYTHDKPGDMLERLRLHSFTIGAEEALLALDLSQELLTVELDPGFRIHRVSDPSDLPHVMQVKETVWGRPFPELRAQLEYELLLPDSELGLYLVYYHDTPVANARMYYRHGDLFGSLWSGATLKEYRGRGLYRALVERRARDAKKKGARYLTVDALPTSRPILERLGFVYLASTYPCEWQPEGA